MTSDHHNTTAKKALLIWLLACLASFSFTIQVLGQRTSRPIAAQRTVKEPLRLVVLPFRNGLPQQTSGDDIAVLGDGIADSLTNALKSVARLTVVDTAIVLKAAERFSGVAITAKDDDAISVADSLSAQIVVAGSFQLFKNRLQLDARILTVQSGKAIPAKPISINANYPDGYASLLSQLATAITKGLQIPLSTLEAASVQSVVGSTRSPQAYQLYMRGTQQARLGTEAALSEAIKHFSKALEIDPNYGMAYAGKSEAETQLFEAKKARGERETELANAALNDASTAVAKSPNIGRGALALAEAQTSLGNYDAAVTAAKRATTAWPNDAAAYKGLARAIGRGNLFRGREMDRALSLQPALALLLPQLPKVVVKNESEYTLTVKFNPSQGQSYAKVQVPSSSSKVVALFPGQFQVLIESEVGALEDQHSFEAGQEYRLDYSATSFPLATLTLINAGNLSLRAKVSGPLGTSIVLRAQESKNIKLPPGKYSVTATIPGASKSDQLELLRGQERSLKYEYKGVVFDPAELTVENNGNAALTVSMRGPKAYTLNVPSGGKTFMLQAGVYEIRLSCGRQGTESREYELKPRYETTISEFSCNIRYVVR